MNSTIYQKHNISVPPEYMPSPENHLSCERDARHYDYTAKYVVKNVIKTYLDVGSWDSWLALIIAKHYKYVSVETIELIPDLALSAYRYALSNDVNNFIYHIGAWEDYPIEDDKTWDLITCYEVLEHVPITDIDAFVEKIDKHARHVIISLPNQSHLDNQQHQWTPDVNTIGFIFKDKKNLVILYKDYTTSTIPGNWFISYDTGK